MLEMTVNYVLIGLLVRAAATYGKLAKLLLYMIGLLVRAAVTKISKIVMLCAFKKVNFSAGIILLDFGRTKCF